MDRTPPEALPCVSRRQFLRLGLAGSGMLGLVGALPPLASAAPAPAVHRQAAGGRITVAISVDIKGFDPARSPDVTSINVGFSILEAALRLEADGTVKPSLAESWRNIDPTTWEFTLRDATFHNGEAVTSEHVRFSIEHNQQPGASGAGALTPIERIEPIDTKTFRVTTKGPDPLFLKRMARHDTSILPMGYIGQKGWDEFAQNPVGTGAFVFTEWVKDGRIAFRANPNYWGGMPRASELIWKPIPESAARVAALQTGEVDIIVRIPPTQVRSLQGASNFDIVKVLGSRNYYIALDNMKDTPIKDRRVRLALNHAVDVDAIIQYVLDGSAERVNSIIGNVEFGYDPSIPPLPYDVAKAKALLKEAGYGDGFKTTISAPNGAYVMDKEVCQAVAGFLADVGVEAEIKVYESVNFWDLQAKKQLSELFFDGVGDRNLDADGPLRSVVSAAAPWTVYDNPEVERLIQQGGSTIDQEERKRIYSRITRLLQEDPAFISLYQVYDFYGVSKRLEGFQPRSNELMLFRDVAARA